MLLRTGREIYGYAWKPVPVTDDVIAKVDELGEEEGQPIMVNRPIFELTRENQSVYNNESLYE